MRIGRRMPYHLNDRSSRKLNVGNLKLSSLRYDWCGKLTFEILIEAYCLTDQQC